MPKPPCPGQGRTGLPVRAWRDLASAIGIRKAGPAAPCLPLAGSWGQAARLWESRCEDGVGTLECNTQRAALLQGRYNSILITLMRTMLHPFYFSQVCRRLLVPRRLKSGMLLTNTHTFCHPRLRIPFAHPGEERSRPRSAPPGPVAPFLGRLMFVASHQHFQPNQHP